MFLGRFQQGQSVKIGVPTVDGGGDPVAPDAAPTAAIMDPNSVSLPTLKLAMDGGPTAFALSVFLGLGFSLGTYTVTYSYLTGGVTRTASDTFEVIPGGDPGGRVISLCAFDRPEARYVVAQLSSGMVLQGKNPRL